MSKLRYVLVLAALYGPCSFAADPVATRQADKKIMYGTAAVRPTPDAFDLASRGMCYVATDTNAVTEWTGTAWISAATCGGGAGSSSTSPAYVIGGYTSGTCADDGDVDTLETICEVTVSGYNSITFQGTVATANFSDFNIDFSNDGTNYVNYYTATADYTPICSADPTAWSSTHILCRLSGLAGIQKVRLQAAGTSSNPTITYQVQQ